MKTKTLGRTDLKVSIVGLGAMYSGKPANSGISSPDMNFDLGVKTIQAAIENGCTLVDTAYVYSRGGSEKIIGEAVEHRRKQQLTQKREQWKSLKLSGTT